MRNKVKTFLISSWNIFFKRREAFCFCFLIFLNEYRAENNINKQWMIRILAGGGREAEGREREMEDRNEVSNKEPASYKDSDSEGQSSEQATSRCASAVCGLFELRAIDTLWAQEELLPTTPLSRRI